MHGFFIPIRPVRLTWVLAHLVISLRPVLAHGERARPDARKFHTDGVADKLSGLGRSRGPRPFLAASAMAHELAQSHHAACVSSCDHILLAKRRHEDVAVGRAIVVVDDADEAIGRLIAIGVGHTVAFIEHETATPSLAVVFGEISGEVRATGACVDGSVFHKEQVSRKKTAEEKARGRVLDGRGFQLRPRFAVVSGDAFANAVSGANEQPKGAVCAFHKHVLVGLARILWHIATAAQGPSLACIGGDDQLRAIVPNTPPVAAPLADRQSPLARGENDRLAHHHSLADPARPRPRGLPDIGLGGFHAPHLGFHRVSPLRPKEEKTAIGRHPQLWIETARGAAAIGINGEHLGPRRAVVAAGGEHNVVVRVFAGRNARVPNGPYPPLQRDGNAWDASEGAVGDVMLRAWSAKMLRWLERG